MSTEESSVSALLKQYPELIEVFPGKIKCSLSGHEIARCTSAIKSYVTGSKFQRLKALNDVLKDYGQYFDEFGRNKDLYCKVTKRSISRDGNALRGHVNGKRFKKGLAKYLATLDDEGQSTSISDQKVNSQLVTSNKMRHEVESADEDITDVEEESIMDDDPSSDSPDEEYPELADDESDYDWSIMNTEIDSFASGTQKRKSEDSCESRATYKRWKD